MKSRTENKREQNERNREQIPNQASLDPLVTSYDPQGLYSLPIEGKREQFPNPTTLNHSITSYDPQGSNGDLILLTHTPSPQEEKNN